MSLQPSVPTCAGPVPSRPPLAAVPCTTTALALCLALSACGGAYSVPLYALTNWSSETFPPQRERFPFLSWFDDLVISGVEGVIKPDPRIFRILLERNAIAPESAVFIDDVAANADAAARLGIHGIHFRSPAQLRRDLAAVGLLPESP